MVWCVAKIHQLFQYLLKQGLLKSTQNEYRTSQYHYMPLLCWYSFLGSGKKHFAIRHRKLRENTETYGQRFQSFISHIYPSPALPLTYVRMHRWGHLGDTRCSMRSVLDCQIKKHLWIYRYYMCIYNRTIGKSLILTLTHARGTFTNTFWDAFPFPVLDLPRNSLRPRR